MTRRKFGRLAFAIVVALCRSALSHTHGLQPTAPFIMTTVNSTPPDFIDKYYIIQKYEI